jgi:hypothetical protein
MIYHYRFRKTATCNYGSYRDISSCGQRLYIDHVIYRITFCSSIHVTVIRDRVYRFCVDRGKIGMGRERMLENLDKLMITCRE